MSSTLLSRLVFFLLLAVAALPGRAQTSGAPPAYFFGHLAGPTGGYGIADGTGAAARFWNPAGLARDSAGNIFVADASTRTVRKVTPGGVVTTVVTPDMVQDVEPGSPLYQPYGLAVDSADQLFISDVRQNRIFKLTPAGVLTKYAGHPFDIAYLNQSTDGALADATFDGPQSLAFDSAGNLYVADSHNHVIRKITQQGNVTTFAGMPPAYNHPQGAGVNRIKYFPGSADGTGTSAQFYAPSAVACDAAGNVYVADTLNHTIRKVTPSGVVTTLAGAAGQQGSTDGIGAAARFRQPYGLAVDLGGNVFVSDRNNNVVRKIAPDGTVTTLAGTVGASGVADGTGGQARFTGLLGLVLDVQGNLLVGDGDGFAGNAQHAGTIRRITPTGAVTTFVGQAMEAGIADGTGTAARFNQPFGVAVDAAGNTYVADRRNHAIRRITPAGVVTTFAGMPGQSGSANGAASVARFAQPAGIAIDAAGNLYVTDHDNHTIRKIAPDGFVTTLAGFPGNAGTSDGTGEMASFHNPLAITIDNTTGNIFVSDGDYLQGGDPSMEDCTIRKITPAGVVTTLAGDPSYVDWDYGYGERDGTGPNAKFARIFGMTVDTQGVLYVADTYARKIKRVTQAGVSTTWAGLKMADGSDLTRFYPAGIVLDGSGNLIATDFSGHLVYRITPDGVITTIGGSRGRMGSKDGLGAEAQFNQPVGIALDNKGQIYLADSENNAIRRGVIAGAPAIATQPQSQTVAAGGSVQLSVTASGVPDPTYQWFFNGAAFSGATGSTLSFSNARSSDAGDYTVTATNAVGSVTSTKATLTVTSAPATPPSPPSGGGGGGGGAPSLWFAGALALLAGLRSLRICIHRMP